MKQELRKRLNEKYDPDTAVIAVIIRDRKILLGLRDYKGGPTVWTAPGGSLDDGENLEAAARRETKEETGIDDLEFIDYIGNVKADHLDHLHIFYCASKMDPYLAEPEKFREWHWFALEEFASGEPDNYINEPSRDVIVAYLAENDIL